MKRYTCWFVTTLILLVLVAVGVAYSPPPNGTPGALARGGIGRPMNIRPTAIRRIDIRPLPPMHTDSFRGMGTEGIGTEGIGTGLRGIGSGMNGRGGLDPLTLGVGLGPKTGNLNGLGLDATTLNGLGLPGLGGVGLGGGAGEPASGDVLLGLRLREKRKEAVALQDVLEKGDFSAALRDDGVRTGQVPWEVRSLLEAGQLVKTKELIGVASYELDTIEGAVAKRPELAELVARQGLVASLQRGELYDAGLRALAIPAEKPESKRFCRQLLKAAIPTPDYLAVEPAADASSGQGPVRALENLPAGSLVRMEMIELDPPETLLAGISKALESELALVREKGGLWSKTEEETLRELEAPGTASKGGSGGSGAGGGGSGTGGVPPPAPFDPKWKVACVWTCTHEGPNGTLSCHCAIPGQWAGMDSKATCEPDETGATKCAEEHRSAP